MLTLSRTVYISEARTTLSPEAVTALAAKSAAKNRLIAVSGLLLYSQGNFMQCLEGEPRALELIYHAISADTRHHRIVRLVDEPTSARLFPNWSMGVLNLDSESFRLDRQCLLDIIAGTREIGARARPATVIQLLREFRSQLPAPAHTPVHPLALRQA